MRRRRRRHVLPWARWRGTGCACRPLLRLPGSSQTRRRLCRLPAPASSWHRCIPADGLPRAGGRHWSRPKPGKSAGHLNHWYDSGEPRAQHGQRTDPGCSLPFPARTVGKTRAGLIYSRCLNYCADPLRVPQVALNLGWRQPCCRERRAAGEGPRSCGARGDRPCVGEAVPRHAGPRRG